MYMLCQLMCYLVEDNESALLNTLLPLSEIKPAHSAGAAGRVLRNKNCHSQRLSQGRQHCRGTMALHHPEATGDGRPQLLNKLTHLLKLMFPCRSCRSCTSCNSSRSSPSVSSGWGLVASFSSLSSSPFAERRRAAEKIPEAHRASQMYAAG